MSVPQNLRLRIINSPFLAPFNDITVGSVLTYNDVDGNFLHVKGLAISGISSNNNILSITRLNGDVLTANTITNPIYTTGTTLINNMLYFDRTDQLSAYTVDLSSLNEAEYWTSGSSGTYSIKANNDSGLDSIGVYSVAEGNKTTAVGNYSHSEGNQTTTSGDASHSEGYNSIAIGIASHAEGGATTAVGDYSHGEGSNTFTNGYSSHAEGGGTSALGDYSHAEGYQTIASDYTSHAGGSYSSVSGETSFVHTYSGNVISSSYSTILGGLNSNILGHSTNVGIFNGDSINILDSYNCNVLSSVGSSMINQDTSIMLGGFYSTITGSSPVDCYENTLIGSVGSGILGDYITFGQILGGASNNITGNTFQTSDYATILNGNANTIADSYSSTIINGYLNTIQVNSLQSTIINGQENLITKSDQASSLGGLNGIISYSNGSSLIGGQYNVIDGDSSETFTRYFNGIFGGYNNTINNAELSFILGGFNNLIDYGTFGAVILGGDGITANTSNTVYVQRLNIKYAPNNNTTTKLLTLNNLGQVCYRDISSISGGTGSGGTFTDVFWDSGTTGSYSLKTLNDSTTDATGDYALAEGENSLAEGTASHAEGHGTTAIGHASHTEGHYTTAKGVHSHAGGASSVASGNCSFIHSSASTVSGVRSVVLGGQNINGSANDTVYVPNLNINTAPTSGSTSTNVLVRNGGGIVETRNDVLFRTKLQYLNQTGFTLLDEYTISANDTVEYIYRCVDANDSTNAKTGKLLLSVDGSGTGLKYTEYGVEQHGDTSGIDLRPQMTWTNYIIDINADITSGSWNVYLTRIVY